MKALSIRQPWAWLIVSGRKDVENRSWPTRVRGRFLVHAAQRFDMQGYEWVRSHLKLDLPDPGTFERGGIVGEAEIVDCVVEHRSLWFSGPFGFVLRNARPLPFRPQPGRLGFFEVEP